MLRFNELSDVERASVSLKASKVESQMRGSGEWQKLKEKHFPPEEKKIFNLPSTINN